MTPALEYYLRSGLPKQKFQFPCSLYLDHIKNNNDKIIITINWHRFSGKYLIKKWDLNKFNSPLPPFTEISLEGSCLFDHHSIILPQYQTIEYQETPYRRGVRQRNDLPMSRFQENEYSKTVENYFNSNRHKKYKQDWLWNAFLYYFGINLPYEMLRYSTYTQQELFTIGKNKTISNNWDLWKKMYCYETEIATELIYQAQYDVKLRKELDYYLKQEEYKRLAFGYPFCCEF